MSGELVGADEAHRAGLINGVVPAGELLARAETWARACAEGGPRALAFERE